MKALRDVAEYAGIYVATAAVTMVVGALLGGGFMLIAGHGARVITETARIGAALGWVIASVFYCYFLLSQAAKNL